jgi:hypothetical protein
MGKFTAAGAGKHGKTATIFYGDIDRNRNARLVIWSSAINPAKDGILLPGGKCTVLWHRTGIYCSPYGNTCGKDLVIGQEFAGTVNATGIVAT